MLKFSIKNSKRFFCEWDIYSQIWILKNIPKYFVGMESSILINYSTSMHPSDQGTRVVCVCVCVCVFVCCMDLLAS
jgi:hypothetical protein